MKRKQPKQKPIYRCCVCGAPANFGRNVSLRASGDWFCSKHWRDE